MPRRQTPPLLQSQLVFRARQPQRRKEIFALAGIEIGGRRAWDREKLMPLAMAIANFAATNRRRAIDRHATEVSVRRLLEAWDKLLEGGWRGPAIGAALNTGFDILTLAFLFLSTGHGVPFLILIADYGVPNYWAS